MGRTRTRKIAKFAAHDKAGNQYTVIIYQTFTVATAGAEELPGPKSAATTNGFLMQIKQKRMFLDGLPDEGEVELFPHDQDQWREFVWE